MVYPEMWSFSQIAGIIFHLNCSRLKSPNHSRRARNSIGRCSLVALNPEYFLQASGTREVYYQRIEKPFAISNQKSLRVE